MMTVKKKSHLPTLLEIPSKILPKIPQGIIFLQARISSTRLPGKVLKTVRGKELLTYLIERLTTIRLVKKEQIAVVLLVPKTECRAFDKLAKKFPALKIFSGAKHNVLSRYYHASQKFPARHHIRVTGDNPFTSITCLKKIFTGHLKVKADVSYYRGLPYGAGVEVVSANALALAYRQAKTKGEREHVTPWLHERLREHYAKIKVNSKNAKTPVRVKSYTVTDFKKHRLIFYTPIAPCGYNHPEVRVTVDTPEDFKVFKERVNRLRTKELSYSLANLLKIIKKTD